MAEESRRQVGFSLSAVGWQLLKRLFGGAFFDDDRNRTIRTLTL